MGNYIKRAIQIAEENGRKRPSQEDIEQAKREIENGRDPEMD